MRNYKIKTFNASTRILRRLEHPTMRFIMWLMLVSVLLVFAMTPILDANRKGTLNAGQTDTGVQYTSAPWVQVNNGTALFTSGSGINATTLYDLLSKVNQTSVWESYKTENSNAYLSAKNFGKLNGTNAQLQVQLFDSAILGTISTANNTNLNIDGATSVLWQAVYRSMGSTGDVLTLYMNDIYCDDVYFDNTSPYYGYYKDSNLREVAQGTYTALKNKYTTLDIYTVLPQNVPGQWQSSDNQTGSDKTQSSYASGASKAYSSASYDAINNGLDDFGTKHTSWTNSSTTTTTPYNNDKLWVPSNYEVIYKDNTTDGSTSYVSSYSSVDATLTNGTSGGSDGENDGRSGLWELSGYDRASGSWAWLRSGYSNSDDYARAVYSNGDLSSRINVYNTGGVRVALHLNLESLASSQLASISASANASGGASSVSTAVSGHEALQTKKTDFNYSNYVIPQDDTAKGKRTITFSGVNTTTHKISSVELQQGDTTKTISVTTEGGSGTRESTGVCDYSYTYSGGTLTIEVKDVSKAGALNVQAIVVEAQTDMTLNLQVTNSAKNSLLVLTFLNGDNKIGEYGFVYSGGVQTASIILPQNTTIKILATKPFGSRVEFEFDNVAVSPSGVTSYLINTGNASSKTLTVTLTGDGSWSNAIVI